MSLCIVIYSVDKTYRCNCILLYLVQIDFMKNHLVFLNLSQFNKFSKRNNTFYTSKSRQENEDCMQTLLELNMDFVIEVTFLILCLVLFNQVGTECYFVSNKVFNCEIEIDEFVLPFNFYIQQAQEITVLANFYLRYFQDLVDFCEINFHAMKLRETRQ